MEKIFLENKFKQSFPNVEPRNRESYFYAWRHNIALQLAIAQIKLPQRKRTP